MARKLKIAYLTAGAAGMICGSCLHDNTLARALIALGHDVQLIPLYTPIRTDEQDVSIHRVFYGGINMYLQQELPPFRWLPKWLDRWLDQPWLIDWAAGRSVKIEPQQVADLTLSILRGREGFQRKEVERLAEWLTGDLHPDVIVFSNILTAGCVPEIKRRMKVPIVVTLQGDDIFLRGLESNYQQRAIAEIHKLIGQIDGFIANTRFYADYMAEYLGIPGGRIEIVPLGIDTRDFVREDEAPAEPGFRVQGSVFGEQRAESRGQRTESRDQEGSVLTSDLCSLPSPSPRSALRTPHSANPTIGYLARLDPAKGLHVLADAFIKLRQMAGMESVRLKVAGWLGKQHREYAEAVFGKLRAAGLGEAFEYVGEVDRRGKLDLLASIDVLSVPTTYREPKGLFVLEALAAGVPVVQPEHGAFPEVLAELGGGLLHQPEDPQHLAERLRELLLDGAMRERLGKTGRSAVLAGRNEGVMAERTAAVLERIVERAAGGPAVPQVSAAEEVSAAERT